MKKLLWMLIFLVVSRTVLATSPCPVTVGSLTLNAYQPRNPSALPSGQACISPCLLFFDTTGSPQFLNSDSHHTTESAALGGINDVIIDVYYAWDFGDTNASGTGTWANGNRPGVNSKNKATGPIAAHLYILPTNSTTDYTTTVQLSAYDGTNTASCTLPVTIYAPSGTNGFPGTSTICAFNSAVGSGCPAGAATVTASTLSAATAGLTSGKRVLLKCGDTFSGNMTVAQTVVKASLGAYGGCENTTTNRPKLTGTSGNVITLQGTPTTTTFTPGATDVRIADLDFQDGTHGSYSINAGYATDGVGNTFVEQITAYNINSQSVQGIWFSEAGQSGLINSTVNSGSNYPGFINVGGSHCINRSAAAFCGGTSYSQSQFLDVSYNAFMGNFWDDSAAISGTHNVRIGVCRMCVFSNTTLTGTFGANAILKIDNGKNPQCSSSCPGCASNCLTIWSGQYTEIFELSDNILKNGPVNGFEMAIAPENNLYNEQHRYVVFERNLSFLNSQEATGPLISVLLSSFRNNVVYSASASNPNMQKALYATHQGAEPATQPGFIEFYNNTCYGPTAGSRIQTSCVQVDQNTNSFAANNLLYTTGAAVPAAQNQTNFNSGQAANVFNNNTTNSTLNFSPGNPSGTFQNITDYKPAANATGATSAVPNYFDATGLSWIGAYQLGALSHAAPAP